MNFSDGVLNAENADKYAFIIHNHINDHDFVNEFIKKFSINQIIETKNSGLISNIILHLTLSKSDVLIRKILYLTKKLNEIKLMKRDYLNLVKYYYLIDKNKALDIYESNILSTDCVFTSEDIKFIIQNKLFNLLIYVQGLYINTDIEWDELIDPSNLELRKFIVSPKIKTSVKKIIDNKLGKFLFSLEHFMEKNKNKNFMAIIDAGNILHSRDGQVSDKSIEDFINIVNKTIELIGLPIIIIHRKHIMSHNKILNFLNENSLAYYYTPYDMNDDVFVLWFFIMSNGKLNLISNDKFRDHIHKYMEQDKNINIHTHLLKNIISEQTLNFNVKTGFLQNPNKYSNCIQQIDNHIYVPHSSGKFIKIKLTDDENIEI